MPDFQYKPGNNIAAATPPEKSDNTALAGEATRYIAATVLSAAASLTLPVILHELINIAEEVSVGLSLFCVFIMNFFMIRLYVFRSVSRLLPEFYRFFTVSIGFRVAEYLMFLFGFRLLEINYIVALVLALSLSFFCKFIVQRAFVFNQ